MKTVYGITVSTYEGNKSTIDTIFSNIKIANEVMQELLDRGEYPYVEIVEYNFDEQ